MRLCRATIVARLALLLAGLLATAASAQQSGVLPEAPPIEQRQMLDFSLMEALVTVGAHDLAGVFGFVPPEAAPAAFADYLLHNRKAMKRLIKKGQRDLREVDGVNGWEKLVFIQILHLHANGPIPPGVERLSTKEEYNVSELVLARPMTIQEMATLRGAKR